MSPELTDGRRQRKALEAASLGQAVELLGSDVVRDGRALGVDLRRCAGDVDDLRDVADVEPRREFDGPTQQDQKVVVFRLLEATELDDDAITARVQIQNAIGARDVGNGHANLPRLPVSHCHRGARHRCGTLVQDDAAQGAEPFLPLRRTGADQGQPHQHRHGNPAPHVARRMKPCRSRRQRKSRVRAALDRHPPEAYLAATTSALSWRSPSEQGALFVPFRATAGRSASSAPQ